MQKPIYLHQDYTLNEEGYQLKLPLNLETIIPADDSVRLLSQFVEAMDLRGCKKSCVYGKQDFLI